MLFRLSRARILLVLTNMQICGRDVVPCVQHLNQVTTTQSECWGYKHPGVGRYKTFIGM
jgi:hypothetical protein